MGVVFEKQEQKFAERGGWFAELVGVTKQLCADLRSEWKMSQNCSTVNARDETAHFFPESTLNSCGQVVAVLPQIFLSNAEDFKFESNAYKSVKIEEKSHTQIFEVKLGEKCGVLIALSKVTHTTETPQPLHSQKLSGCLCSIKQTDRNNKNVTFMTS